MLNLFRRDVQLTGLSLFISFVLLPFEVVQLTTSKTRAFMLSTGQFGSGIFGYELYMSEMNLWV